MVLLVKDEENSNPIILGKKVVIEYSNIFQRRDRAILKKIFQLTKFLLSDYETISGNTMESRFEYIWKRKKQNRIYMKNVWKNR